MIAVLSFLALTVGAQAAGPALDELRQLAPPASLTAPKPRSSKASNAPASPCVFDGRTGRLLSADEAFRRAAASQVVYAGEKHDDASHHLFQRDLIARLGAAGAFEMLYASQQSPLDRYLQGGLTGEEFQRAVDWKKTWGFPFGLYEPIFEGLRQGSRRGLALNITKSIVHQVAMEGLSSLSPEQRREVPPDFRTVTDASYIAKLRETFKQHGDPNDEAAFGRYVDAMSLWNEAMAYHLAEALRQSSGAPVVVVAGAFHAYEAGIPEGVARRRPGLRQTSFILESLAVCPETLPQDGYFLDAEDARLLGAP